jgi:hypothetical protein
MAAYTARLLYGEIFLRGVNNNGFLTGIEMIELYPQDLTILKPEKCST